MTTVAETAQALVRIPSVNPQYDETSTGEGGIVAWIEAWARRHGVAARLDEVLPLRRNLLLTVANGPGPHVLLAGHTDTVAVAGMEVAPFAGELIGGRLFGRGSADMKGPLAAMLHALLLLRDRRESWQGAVSVAGVVDEEYQARGIKALIARPDSRFDYAIVGEPTRMEVMNGCKGCLRFSFAARGRAAHSSTPEQGRNAIVAMSGAVLALQRYFSVELAAVERAGFGTSTGSIGLIHGGTGVNVVADRCAATVDIRLLPGQAWSQVYATLRARVEATSAGTGITWEFTEAPFVDPAFETAADHRLVRTALERRGQAQARAATFCCDASKIAAAGVPCIILGPGDIAEAHTARESIAVADLEAAAGQYAELAQALLASKPEDSP